MWRHNRHCYIMEVTLVLSSFECEVLSRWNLVKYLRAVRETFLTCFWLSVGDWKLVLGSFMILLKWRYSKIWPFLIVDIYHFYLHLIHLFKKIKNWNLDIISYWVIGEVAKLKRTWNLASVFQIVQKFRENYCSCFYLSICPVW